MCLPRQERFERSEERLVDDLAGCTPLVTLGFLRRSPHAVKLVDRDGRLLYLNENAMAFHQIQNVDEAVGKLWWEVAGPHLRHTLRNLVTRGGLGENIRTEIERRDYEGRPCRMNISVTPVRCREMRVSKLLVVCPLIFLPVEIVG
ncbi:PAS domain-containing protein [Palleronia sp.]|uniref:PAS domain-containing protein n=1 Tax=Palleronia sp. TaxID=1940284 RepID=UPI0035C85905